MHSPTQWILRIAYEPVNQWRHDPDLWRRGLARFHVTRVVENPTPEHGSVLESLEDIVVPVARSRAATLYRVRQPGEP